VIDVLDQVEFADSRIRRLRWNKGEVHAHVGRRYGLAEADDAHLLRLDYFSERLVELRKPGGVSLQVPDLRRREEQKSVKVETVTVFFCDSFMITYPHVKFYHADIKYNDEK